jgi:KDO2-lipid IV(A) lauroyltransferase
MVSDFGGWLFKWAGPLTSAHRVAERNLRLAFPEADDARIAALLKAQWENTGRTFVELPIMDRILADPERCQVDGAERLAAIAAAREPVVMISIHMSNWEVTAATVARSGIVCQITYRALNNPYVDARVKKSRFRYGVRLFAPKGGDGARELLDAMGRGESVALMNDQKFNGGVAAPLFGHLAHTAPGPSRLALRFGAQLLPMVARRVGKARFRVTVCDPIPLDRDAPRPRAIEDAVRKINAFVEASVRENPEEWFWVHKRWPNEVYRKGAN